ncbi:hypothetical protein ACIPZF_14625 [Pseudomonas sp. NPDC089752]|uniref:hypothetical protein n=1 Tax=Pseudomonas sp. NPDC089752 TaxID=3364472 RepID=UPI00380548A4
MSKHQSVAPLTIIALFAGIIEASALATLPFLSDTSQSLYTWFLVGFPFFLTALFFLTLNFNYKSFYKPDRNISIKHTAPLKTPEPLPSESDSLDNHVIKPIMLMLSGPEAQTIITTHVLKLVTQTPVKSGTWIYCNLDKQQSFRLSISEEPHDAVALLD